jgi:hypothetical protein
VTAPVDESARWIHRLPRVPVVRKDDLLAELVTGRTVLHAGFCGRNEGALAVPIWVHGELARTAKSIIGLDLDEEGIAEARAAGFEAYSVDCQDSDAVRSLGISADMVVAGELIEHLDAPGNFLEAMHELAEQLVVTTPNAFSLINFFGLLTNREVVHPDHVALYSWYTLTNLLRRHGWDPAQVYVYRYETGDEAGAGDAGGAATAVRSRGRRMVRSSLLAVQTALSRYQPFFAHGLVVVCNSVPAGGCQQDSG